MRFVLASDEDLPVVAQVSESLARRGHAVLTLTVTTWAKAALEVARDVAGGKADAGIVFCQTGTGVSIAANKVGGVRAALCVDAETAAGARKWNDANVLALSLRLLTPKTADEILDAWLGTPYGGSEGESLAAIASVEDEQHEATVKR
jgi:ribose 5-phosphate isomerase B